MRPNFRLKNPKLSVIEIDFSAEIARAVRLEKMCKFPQEKTLI